MPEPTLPPPHALPLNHPALRSEEMHEVMQKIPSWMSRWGISLIFALLLLVIGGSYLIKYPDNISTSLRLTTKDFPKSVHARVEGKLVSLLVADNQKVQRGEALAFLESTARPEQVLELSAWLRKLEASLRKGGGNEATDQLLLEPVTAFQQLGELQVDFQAFTLALAQYKANKLGHFYSKKRAMLVHDLQTLSALRGALLTQRTLYEEDLALATQEFLAQQELYEKKVIAPLDFRQQQSRYLSKKFPLEQMNVNLLNNDAQQTTKRGELIELDNSISQQDNVFAQALNSLQSAVQSWESKYVLSAPTSGTVFFNSFLQETQSVAIGQEILTVAPARSEAFGEVNIPQYNLGKIKVNQTVMIKFASYPFQEFGAVVGKVVYISDVPLKDGTFLAKVTLPNGLKTTYNKTIVFRAGMLATAEIITDETRLFDKIFYNILKAIKPSGVA
ncbi:HlyD family efflux transporter periplasmic adaptor subunit [Hymenobacter lutimineralis]|uniref:HlyD family efflux transporter periplasmic adaptor subunit n=1 Tax=Hymenobacter lutimineralis TaxID=2606448 RepID=A0A5D6V9K3_9BACT|nr:HlyD family efflux transporter periplasmic adaptor subunit [Hymenobacter lutimineralis]TYZ12651.1 HlyD family efflux transporter periplasmic adaptor subunit [Hymenobacter lutimineralis]